MEARLKGEKRPRRRLPARLVVPSVALALLSTACGSGSSSPSSSDAPLEETSSSVAPESTVPRPDQTGGGGGRRINVALPAGGPIDNVIPPNTHAYRLLTSGRCDELLREIDTKWVVGNGQGKTNRRDFYLYRGAARACKGQWDGARQDRQALGGASYDAGEDCPQPPDSEEPCERCKAAVLRWLDSVLAARAQDPSYSPVFVPAPRSSQLCPAATTTKPPTTDSPTTEPTTTDTSTEDTSS